VSSFFTIYCSLSKIRPPPIFAASYCKGSFITRKYVHPTNQNNIDNSMHNDESVVYVWAYYTLYCVCMITSGRTRAAPAEEDAVGEQQLKRAQSGAQFGLTKRVQRSPETLPYKARQSRGCARLSLGTRLFAQTHAAVAGAGAIGEQVASEQSKRGTCRGYYLCCTVLMLFCLLLHYKSEYLGGPKGGGGYFRDRGFSKIRPPPL